MLGRHLVARLSAAEPRPPRLTVPWPSFHSLSTCWTPHACASFPLVLPPHTFRGGLLVHKALQQMQRLPSHGSPLSRSSQSGCRRGIKAADCSHACPGPRELGAGAVFRGPVYRVPGVGCSWCMPLASGPRAQALVTASASVTWAAAVGGPQGFGSVGR